MSTESERARELDELIIKLYGAARHPSPNGAHGPMEELLLAYGAERERQGMEKAAQIVTNWHRRAGPGWELGEKICDQIAAAVRDEISAKER